MDLVFDNNDSDPVYMTLYDRLIFWIGGTAVLFLTFLLIASSLKSEKLRKQPGDLIIAIALSDFVLSILWIIQASWSDSINSDSFCTVAGAIATFAGMTEFLYNMAFNIFLVVSLRNALKQDRIPKKSLHVFPILIAVIYLIVLLSKNEIGRSTVGTCSISTNTQTWLLEAAGPIIVIVYAAVGFYTYYYIRKNAPKCQKAHGKRTQFLLYYQRYVVASTVVYAIIAIFNGCAVAISGGSAAFNALYNLAKLCSPLVLTFIRFNDPLIKKIIFKTLMFWRKDEPKANEALFPANETNDDPDRHPSGEFVFNQLSQNLKVEITYTLLSCVLYADFSHKNGIWESVSTFDKKTDKLYKHERIHLIGEGAMRYLLPSVREELDRTRYTVMPGSLKVYAPEVFGNIANTDKEFFSIQDSLDFAKNRDEITNAIKPGGGKSGEFFFFSRDKKLIIKTIPDVEMNMLVSVLKDYDGHLKENPNSLIAKIYGAYTFESTDYEQKFNLIVMKNICGFPSACVERIYDMKGSRYDREVLKDVGAEANAQSVLKQGVLKDLDFEKFEKKLHIRDHLKEDFIRQIEVDSLFFRRVKLIDYSFMVFCVNKRKYMEEIGRLQDGFTAKNPLGSMENTEEVGMYYNVGIVDYLQPYNFQKAMERSLKKVTKMNMSLDTSSQNPEYYSTRFIDFIKKLV